ncbi:hypothetical protein [Spongiactinospora rosea]|nr:hypothetical protein [Spongiactinospora rosea]
MSLLSAQVVHSTMASAESSSRDCYPITWRSIEVDCYPIAVVVDKWCPGPCPPPCLSCPWEWAIDFRTYPVLPEYLEFQYIAELTRGFLTLHEAARTSDPTAQNQLRREALGYFQLGARAVSGTQVVVEQVGRLDRDTGIFGPYPEPWLLAAASDIADGTSLLRESHSGPGPQPWAAMQEFNEAYLELVYETSIGT